MIRVAEERMAKYDWATEPGNHAFVATVDVDDEYWYVIKIDKTDIRLRTPRITAGDPETRKAQNAMFVTAARNAIRQADPDVAEDVPVFLMFASGFVHAELDRRLGRTEK